MSDTDIIELKKLIDNNRCEIINLNNNIASIRNTIEHRLNEVSIYDKKIKHQLHKLSSIISNADFIKTLAKHVKDDYKNYINSLNNVVKKLSIDFKTEQKAIIKRVTVFKRLHAKQYDKIIKLTKKSKKVKCQKQPRMKNKP